MVRYEFLDSFRRNGVSAAALCCCTAPPDVAIFERKLPLALLLLLLSLSESDTLGLRFELVTAAALPMIFSEKLSTLLLLLLLLPATSVTPFAGCGGGELDESSTMHSIGEQRVKRMACAGYADRLLCFRGHWPWQQQKQQQH